MKDLKEKNVGEIVADDYRTSDIFKSHGIDFCCGGKKSLQKVCEEKHVDLDQITNELLNIKTVSSTTHQFDTWKLDFLSDYIINTHHSYVEREMMVIYEYAKKVSSVHGHHYTEMVEVAEIFYDVAKELVAHMRKEEMILFPYIKELAKALENKTTIAKPGFMSVENPILAMINEHETVGEMLHKIDSLTHNYTPPEDACNTFRVLLAKLNEFENDLHTHIHLENNILFPKAIELEKQLMIS
ncbi:MAG: iron-sulfur cluster repair di-iron protein [Bacteroidota bacterium]